MMLRVHGSQIAIGCPLRGKCDTTYDTVGISMMAGSHGFDRQNYLHSPGSLTIFLPPSSPNRPCLLVHADPSEVSVSGAARVLFLEEE